MCINIKQMISDSCHVIPLFNNINKIRKQKLPLTPIKLKNWGTPKEEIGNLAFVSK